MTTAPSEAAAESLYTILQVESSASPDQIKRAYRRLALLHHPDKQPQSSPGSTAAAEASAKFARIVAAYSVLGDADKRACYDASGYFSDAESVFPAKASEKSFQKACKRAPPITLAEIDAWAQTYRASDAEKEDLVDAYKRCAGQMKQILECIPLADWSDAARFRATMQQIVEEEEQQQKTNSIPRFEIFWTSRLLKGTKPRTLQPNAATDADSALILAIRSKNQAGGGRNSFADAVDAIASMKILHTHKDI